MSVGPRFVAVPGEPFVMYVVWDGACLLGRVGRKRDERKWWAWPSDSTERLGPFKSRARAATGLVR